jgi:hypothetical protein
VKSFCEETHSFVLRCWLEPREIESAEPLWRGEVEHVPTGERVFFRSFVELKRFLSSYLPGIAEAIEPEDKKSAQA